MRDTKRERSEQGPTVVPAGPINGQNIATSSSKANGKALTGSLLLRGLDQNHRLRSPLPIKSARVGRSFTISDDLTFRSGQGRSFDDALASYISIVLEYWSTLRENRTRLTPRLARHLALLDGLALV